MEKNLPRVYANPINKTLSNNKDVFYSGQNDTRSMNTVDVTKKINEIFASKTHVYKSKVRIKTNNDTIDEVIVGRTGAYLLTLSGAKISIPTIIDIERI